MSTTQTSNIGPPVSFGLAKPLPPYGITPGQFGIIAMTIFTTRMSQMNYWIWHPSTTQYANGLAELQDLTFWINCSFAASHSGNYWNPKGTHGSCGWTTFVKPDWLLNSPSPSVSFYLHFPYFLLQLHIRHKSLHPSVRRFSPVLRFSPSFHPLCKQIKIGPKHRFVRRSLTRDCGHRLLLAKKKPWGRPWNRIKI